MEYDASLILRVLECEQSREHQEETTDVCIAQLKREKDHCVDLQPAYRRLDTLLLATHEPEASHLDQLHLIALCVPYLRVLGIEQHVPLREEAQDHLFETELRQLKVQSIVNVD